MIDEGEFREVLEGAAALAKRAARGKPPRVRMGKEVAELLAGLRGGPPPVSAAAQASDGKQAPSAGNGGEESLAGIAAEVRACAKCPLHELRNNAVPGEGNPSADLVFVGEAPGADEDRQGRPFVGRAGQLLTDIIVKGMKMTREQVFICNVLKCRPPDNRTPGPDEVFHCEPYLIRQLQLIRPKVICALGGVAAQTLLKSEATVGSLRGKWHNYHGIPLRVTYHPAYLLRSPGEKAKAWLDIQEVMKLLAGQIPPPF